MSLRLRHIGEFGLIDRVKKSVTNPSKSVIIGIGDDAAAITWQPEEVLLLTADAFAEGIHFNTSYATFWQIGWKAMAANLSDIAAMGGRPHSAAICLCVPGDLSVHAVDDLYRGMDAIGSRFGCSLVGGDTITSPGGEIVLSISMIGGVRPDRLKTRREARPGDLLCVTGDLGGAEAGLVMLSEGAPGSESTRPSRRHLEPVPRLLEADTISESTGVHAMIDISDGLTCEVGHLCRESGVGARIFAGRIPIHRTTREVADRHASSGLDYALYGGEDFELLFAIESSEAEEIISAVADRTGTEVSTIGEITDADRGIRLVTADGTVDALPDSGYRHFRG